MKRRCGWLSLLVIAVLLAGLLLQVVWPISHYVAWLPRPAEDAYILFRYSQHLADGHGIVWNIGDTPVDGSTDFLWMLALAAWAAVFGSVIPGFYILGTIFAVGAAAVAYFTIKWLQLPIWPAALFAGAILISPLAYHTVNGFGVPLYVLILGIDLSLFLVVGLRPKLLWAWAFAMLLAGLARPEANIFNGILLLLYLIRQRRVPIPVLIAYVLPGIAYLLFRISYFGYILPALAYVKIGAQPLLSQMWENMAALWFPVLIPQIGIALVLFLSRRRELIMAYLAVIAYFVAYLGFDQIQNIAMRFQYHTFYLSMLIACIALAYHKRKWLALPLLASWIAFMLLTPPLLQRVDDRWQVADILMQYSGYTLATTEAGVIPFVSGWRTLDLYGLNDYHIARNGLDQGYWDLYNPAVVLNHTYVLDPSEETEDGNRHALRAVMRDDYELVAVVNKISWLGHRGYHAYFIRRDIPDFLELSTALQNLSGQTYAGCGDSRSPNYSSYGQCERNQQRGKVPGAGRQD